MPQRPPAACQRSLRLSGGGPAVRLHAFSGMEIFGSATLLWMTMRRREHHYIVHAPFVTAWAP